MKNKSRQLLAALAIAFILLAANNSFAQNTKRIEFAKSNSATMKGAGNQSYVFRANGEQTIKIRLVSKNSRATFDLLDAEGSDLTEGSDGRKFEMATTGAGEYRINVSAAQGAAFTLTVSIK